ncbi:hypothetical protein SAMN05443668_108207 [Cryptosporangium aurantiacum]|uniref:Uncharacterized protein n=2 Tax=Cryptosporangium aurantiacum TaxID=134849 RepID=A0A1M7R8G3_9ACTN|nr:hypothetical protein SAMN05443668_108207 [Cryptosporangium aurantiacum]
MLVVVGLLLLGATACSSSDDAPQASGTSTSVPTTAPASTPSSTGGSGTDAVCDRVVKIVQDSSRNALAVLTPALQTGDQAKVNAAKSKAQQYYAAAADELRKEAAATSDTGLATDIRAAAGYFDKAARNVGATGSDNSLGTLSERCA